MLQLHALIPVVIKIGKAITGVMMETTIVDVNGMVETVVVMMLTHNTVQPVYVLIQMHQDHVRIYI